MRQVIDKPAPKWIENRFPGDGPMACPECGSRKVAVIDCRPKDSGRTVRRRRCCVNGHRFTTSESCIIEREWSNYEI